MDGDDFDIKTEVIRKTYPLFKSLTTSDIVDGYIFSDSSLAFKKYKKDKVECQMGSGYCNGFGTTYLLISVQVVCKCKLSKN
jgi:hypothetical protein